MSEAVLSEKASFSVQKHALEIKKDSSLQFIREFESLRNCQPQGYIRMLV